jgi:AraC family transcriptional regulator
MQEFRLPDAPGLVLRSFQRSAMTFTEVMDSTGRELTTPVPCEDAFLVQLRLIDCPRVEYFADGRHVEGVDTRAGLIQIHDLRRRTVAVIRDPFHILHIRLPLDAISAAAEEMHAPRIDALQLKPSQSLRDTVLRNLMLALQPMVLRPEEANSLMVSYMALAITAHIAQRYGGAFDRSAFRPGGLAGWQVRRALELLDASLAGDISMNHLAMECGLSVRHFARAFHQSVGMPPHRYLLKRRIEAACHLLARHGMSLPDIALACGFADQSHFTRVFRAHVGVPPGTWRRVHIGGK